MTLRRQILLLPLWPVAIVLSLMIGGMFYIGQHSLTLTYQQARLDAHETLRSALDAPSPPPRPDLRKSPSSHRRCPPARPRQAPA